MAYTRDSNAYTRGVGAIAAADGSRARQRRRIAIGKALRARDRVMAQLTYGPRGGAVPLGAIKGIVSAGSPTLGLNRTIDGGSGGVASNQPPTPGPIYPGGPKGGYTGGGGTTSPAPTFNISTVTANAGGSRVIATPRGPRTLPPGSSIIDPGPGGTTGGDSSGAGGSSSSSAGASGGGASYTGGGGGGGGGAGITTGGGTAPDLTPPATPDDIPATTAGMSTTEKVVLAAAAAGALYLMFGKKRGAP